MNRQDLFEAVTEAKRFIAKAEQLKPANFDSSGKAYGKEAAAVKRSSLDLTTALAKIRRRETWSMLTR